MSTALDLAALAAQGELKIPIARGVVSEGGSGTDYTGWSGVSSVFVEAKVEVREQSRGFATLTLTVEGSANGSDWSTLETFTFGHGGSQSATVSSPDDHLRVSWAVGGGSEWQIIEVTAAPSIIDTGAGGGSQAHTREVVTSASSVAIADTEQAFLTFAHQAGDALLDYSDPTNPVVIEAGLYAILALATCDEGAQVSGWMDVTLKPQPAPFELGGVDAEANVALDLGLFPIASMTIPAVYLDAGVGFILQVANYSGLGGSLHFSVNVGLVQRIY